MSNFFCSSNFNANSHLFNGVTTTTIIPQSSSCSFGFENFVFNNSEGYGLTFNGTINFKDYNYLMFYTTGAGEEILIAKISSKDAFAYSFPWSEIEDEIGPEGPNKIRIVQYNKENLDINNLGENNCGKYRSVVFDCYLGFGGDFYGGGTTWYLNYIDERGAYGSAEPYNILGDTTLLNAKISIKSEYKPAIVDFLILEEQNYSLLGNLYDEFENRALYSMGNFIAGSYGGYYCINFAQLKFLQETESTFELRAWDKCFSSPYSFKRNNLKDKFEVLDYAKYSWASRSEYQDNAIVSGFFQGEGTFIEGDNFGLISIKEYTERWFNPTDSIDTEQLVSTEIEADFGDSQGLLKDYDFVLYYNCELIGILTDGITPGFLKVHRLSKEFVSTAGIPLLGDGDNELSIYKIGKNTIIPKDCNEAREKMDETGSSSGSSSGSGSGSGSGDVTPPQKPPKPSTQGVLFRGGEKTSLENTTELAEIMYDSNNKKWGLTVKENDELRVIWRNHKGENKNFGILKYGINDENLIPGMYNIDPHKISKLDSSFRWEEISYPLSQYECNQRFAREGGNVHNALRLGENVDVDLYLKSKSSKRIALKKDISVLSKDDSSRILQLEPIKYDDDTHMIYKEMELEIPIPDTPENGKYFWNKDKLAFEKEGAEPPFKIRVFSSTIPTIIGENKFDITDNSDGSFYISSGEIVEHFKLENNDITEVHFERSFGLVSLQESFKDLSNLHTVTFSEMNFRKLETVEDAWNGCSALQTFEVGKIFSGVKTFDRAWYGCTSLSDNFNHSEFLHGETFSSTWENSGVTEVLEIRFWKVITLEAAFRNCANLQSFSFFKNKKLSFLVSVESMFENCVNLTNFNGMSSITKSYSYTKTWYNTQINESPLIQYKQLIRFNCDIDNHVNSYDITEISVNLFEIYGNNITSLSNYKEIPTAGGKIFFNYGSTSTEYGNKISINSSYGDGIDKIIIKKSHRNDFTIINCREIIFENGVKYNRNFSGFNKLETLSLPFDTFKTKTNFSNMWYNCTSLTSIPQLDVSNGTNFHRAWYNCTSLTSIPQLDVSKGIDFSWAWSDCSSLTSIPQMDMSSGTDFSYAWNNCSSLSSFPQLDVSSGTNFSYSWANCSSLTSFPQLDVSNGINFNGAWKYCYGMTSFPQLDVSKGTNFESTWSGCSSLTSFPQLDVSNGTNFYGAWENCSSLTSFPQLDVSNGTNFGSTWFSCSSLTSFPQLDVSNGTNFYSAWNGCSSLPHCPAGNEVTIPAGAYTYEMCDGI